VLILTFINYTDNIANSALFRRSCTGSVHVTSLPSRPAVQTVDANCSPGRLNTVMLVTALEWAVFVPVISSVFPLKIVLTVTAGAISKFGSDLFSVPVINGALVILVVAATAESCPLLVRL
jgi:hypothetical protein